MNVTSYEKCVARRMKRAFTPETMYDRSKIWKLCYAGRSVIAPQGTCRRRCLNGASSMAADSRIQKYILKGHNHLVVWQHLRNTHTRRHQPCCARPCPEPCVGPHRSSPRDPKLRARGEAYKGRTWLRVLSSFLIMVVIIFSMKISKIQLERV